MKHFIIALCLLTCVSAQAISLVIRPVEVIGEDAKKSSDIKILMPIKKEKIVLEKDDWKCIAQTYGQNWGTFRCRNSDDLEVSTRFDFDKAKNFEQSQGFRIFKKRGINCAVFSQVGRKLQI